MSRMTTSVQTEIGKICIGCGNDVPLADFRPQRNAFLGRTSRCNECHRIETVEFRKTPEGIVATMHTAQIAASKKRGHNPPAYTRAELREWVFGNPSFKVLFDNWVGSGYDKWKKPSCDRIDDYKPYILSNLQLVTWRANWERSHQDRINGVNQKQSKAIEMIDRETMKVLRTFYSSAQASRELGVVQAHVGACCRGKRKSSNGYYWRWAQ